MSLKNVLLWILLLTAVFSAYFLIVASERSWQAEAAANDVILLWGGTTSTIPAGWTCVSCRTTDGASATSTFLNAFPKASSTFGLATTSSDSVTHTAAFLSSTSDPGVGVNNSTAGTAVDRSTHTHSWGNPTINAEDIRPPFKNLIMIKATSPTQIPAGAIAMFDVPSGSLPSGWTYYSAIENLYLRASNDVATGGTATGAPTTTATVTSGAAAAGLARTSTGSQINTPAITHTHTIPAGTAIPSANHDPSYIGVVFGQADSTTTIPTGLLAFFDATPPTGWSAISTNGSSWDNRLIVGSTTFGNTGGVATHTHTGAITSSGPSSTAVTDRSGSATNASTNTHTHDITYTISTASSMPVNRGIIIGKKLASYEIQANYRWYANTNSDTPTTTLAALNTSTTAAVATVYRLRMNVKIATSSLSALSQFELQFATSTSGPWSDTGAIGSGVIWRGFSNTTPTDGMTLSSLLLTSSTIKETYQEQNIATGTPNALAINDFGEWDWVLENNGAPGGNYFFRMAWADGTPFDSYQNYPALTTEETISCSANVTNTSFSSLTFGSVFTSTPDVSSTISCGGSLGCTLSVQDTNSGLATTSPAYTIPSASAALLAGTEGYGIQATSTATGSGGLLTFNPIFDDFGSDNVGALSGSTVTLASSTAAVTDREVIVRHKATISGLTPEGSYGDTITYSCVGN